MKLKSFRQFLIEAVSYNYKIPKNFRTQLYDFYLLSLFYQRMQSMTVDDETRSHLPDSTIKDLEMLAETGMKKLAIEQRKILLESVLVSLVAEFRHVWNETKWNFTTIGGSLQIAMNKEIQKFFKGIGAEKKAESFYRMFSKNVEQDIGLGKPKTRRFSGRSFTYNQALNAFYRTRWNPRDFVKTAKIAFQKLKWEQYFGGKNWVAIAEAWLDLDDASDVDKMIQAIDHMYDLEHNTSVVLDKVKEFESNQGYEWIKISLDVKRNSTIQELAKYSSIPNRIVAMYNRLLNLSLYGSDEEYREKDPNASYRIWDNGGGKVHRTSEVDPTTKIERGSVVGPNCRIIGRCVVGGKSTITNVKLHDSSISESTVVGTGKDRLEIIGVSSIGESTIEIPELLLSDSSILFRLKLKTSSRLEVSHKSFISACTLEIENSRFENSIIESSNLKGSFEMVDCEVKNTKLSVPMNPKSILKKKILHNKRIKRTKSPLRLGIEEPTPIDKMSDHEILTQAMQFRHPKMKSAWKH